MNALIDYRTDSPRILRDFLVYHETIRGHSKNTVNEYYYDLLMFFRFLKQKKDPALKKVDFNSDTMLNLNL